MPGILKIIGLNAVWEGNLETISDFFCGSFHVIPKHDDSLRASTDLFIVRVQQFWWLIPIKKSAYFSTQTNLTSKWCILDLVKYWNIYVHQTQNNILSLVIFGFKMLVWLHDLQETNNCLSCICITYPSQIEEGLWIHGEGGQNICYTVYGGGWTVRGSNMF